MRCESCESDVPEADAKAVAWADLSSAATKGFGPWGGAPPSVQWPRLVRHLWWKGAGSEGDATLCPACDGALQRFEAAPATPHEWLTEIREAVGRTGLRLAPTEPLDQSAEVGELAQQLARDLAAIGYGSVTSLKGGFETYGEKYGLAAASILLTGDDSSGDFINIRFRAADLLAQWSDPRATSFLVLAFRNPLSAFWISRRIAERGDLNALPPALDQLADYLRARHRYVAGDPPLRDGFPVDVPRLKATYPDIPPLDVARVATGGVTISSLLSLVTRLGGSDVGRLAMSEVYASSLFIKDVMWAAGELCDIEPPDDAELIALVAFESGTIEDFQRRMAFLVGQQSPAGWWAMDRFCRTEESWRDRVPAVASEMAKIPKPDDETLRKLERRYGRLMDAEREPKSAPQTASQAAPQAKSGCFIATAAYGSEHHVEVARLRTFRADVLRRTRSGRAAIRIYERVSPPVAKIVARSESCRALIRLLILRPMRSIAIARCRRETCDVRADVVADAVLVRRP